MEKLRADLNTSRNICPILIKYKPYADTKHQSLASDFSAIHNEVLLKLNHLLEAYSIISNMYKH
jgi:hypothetical protein